MLVSELISFRDSIIKRLEFLEQDTSLDNLYNIIDLKYIIATFERFNYQIIFSTPNLNEDDSTNKKFDWLMKYLNT